METKELQERIGLDCFDSVLTSVRQVEFQLMVPADPAPHVMASLHSES